MLVIVHLFICKFSLGSVMQLRGGERERRRERESEKGRKRAREKEGREEGVSVKH